ncbi:TPA: helix-turn-helix transcriptional regulator [Burkholderia vietnamiensis]|nr:helix-turn-helix transcriptional regulator [Burkholderia vietnamiensis]
MSFAEWRQQVCLLTAIERLSGWHPVTQVALDVGYPSHRETLISPPRWSSLTQPRTL